jgi:hypothetical protein
MIVRLSQLWSPAWKIADTDADISAGKLSRTKAPLRVSKMGRGRYFVMDGNHRAMEAIMAGAKEYPAVLDPHVPDLLRTGGAYNSIVDSAVNAAQAIHKRANPMRRHYDFSRGRRNKYARRLRRRNPTVYHGTGATFTAFTTDRVGQAHGMGQGWGVYFTNDVAVAQAHAGKTGHVYTAKIPRGPWLPWVGRVTSPVIRRRVKAAFESLRHVTEPCSTHGTSPIGEEYYQRHAAYHAFGSSGGCVYRDLAVLLDDTVGDKVSKLLREPTRSGCRYSGTAPSFPKAPPTTSSSTPTTSP